MNPRNAYLANLIVKEIMGAAHEVALRETENGQTSATRSLVEGTLHRVEAVLNAHNKTDFTDVGFLNEMMGNRHAAATPDDMERQWGLVEEEFAEARIEVENYIAGLRGIMSGDCKQEEVFGTDGEIGQRALLRKELVDLHITAYGFAYRMGADANMDFQSELGSQMSKLYQGDGVGAKVVADEITERTGLEVEIREMALGTFSFVSAREQVDNYGRHYPKGKQLKPHHFQPAKFV